MTLKFTSLPPIMLIILQPNLAFENTQKTLPATSKIACCSLNLYPNLSNGHRPFETFGLEAIHYFKI